MLRVIRRALLSGKSDVYKAFTIDNSALPSDFLAQLDESLASWKDVYRAVWLNLKEDQISLAPACIERGFRTHSCDPSTNTLRLSKWLSNEPSTLPFYSNHYAGVGGVVVDDSDNVLLIKNHHSMINEWRIPGGLVETEEDFTTAVIREVWEETGISAKVLGLLGIRERSQYLFGRRDVYNLFLLEPLDKAIQIHDTHEIADCRWMPISQWLQDAKIGDGVNMLRRLAPESGSYKAAFQSKTLSRSPYEWKTPNYSATHSFWLKL